MTIRKLGRKKEHRERTLRNLATSLVLYEKVETTEAKAKTVAPIVERLISQAIDGSLASRRAAKAYLFDMNAVAKLFEDVAARQGTRTSGFVRITKIAPRAGDGAPRAVLELLLTPIEELVEKQSNAKVTVRKKQSEDAPEAAKAEEAQGE